MITTRLQEALRFWWNHLGPLLVITAPFALIGEIMALWQGPALKVNEEGQLQGITAITLTTLVLLQPFAEGALIARLDSIHRGVARSLGDCVLVGIRAAPFLLAAYALMGLGVYGGLLLLILPGVWVYVRLCLAPFLITLEGRGPVAALQESFLRTAGPRQWTLLLALLLLALLVFSALNLLGAGIAAATAEHPAGNVLLGLITALAGALISVLVFRFYVLSLPPEVEPPSEG